jgi:hypothetical protein
MLRSNAVHFVDDVVAIVVAIVLTNLGHLRSNGSVVIVAITVGDAVTVGCAIEVGITWLVIASARGFDA